jgi:hypothetical protein
LLVVDDVLLVVVVVAAAADGVRLALPLGDDWLTTLAIDDCCVLTFEIGDWEPAEFAMDDWVVVLVIDVCAWLLLASGDWLIFAADDCCCAPLAGDIWSLCCWLLLLLLLDCCCVELLFASEIVVVDKRLSFRLAADDEFGEVDFDRLSYESLGDVGRPLDDNV